MKLKDVVQKVTEMAKVAAVCSHCGQPKTGGHYYYKGAFKCKGTGKTFEPTGSGASAPAAAVQAASPVSQHNVEPQAVGGESPEANAEPTPKFGTKAPPVAAPTQSVAGADAVKASMDKWMKSHNIENYKVQPDGMIDVDGEVRLDNMRMPRLPGPVKFGTVTGDFICSSSGLTALRGCPEHVGTSEFGGDFMCDYNDITSLEGGPKTCGGSYSCTGCDHLENLQHMAEKINGSVFAQSLPKVKNLQGIHKIVRHCGGVFDLTGTKLESHVLGLLMIKGLESVKMDNTQVADILNKHLKQPDRNAHECQEELIDAGFAAFAKL